MSDLLCGALILSAAPPPIITAAFLRERAREFRRQAAEATTPDIQAMLLDLALEYEHDADVMEQS